MDCFGTYFTHVQTCNVTRVPSATQWAKLTTCGMLSKRLYQSHWPKSVKARSILCCCSMRGNGSGVGPIAAAPIWRLPLPVTSEICECYAMSKKSVDRWMHSLHSKKTRFRKTLDWKTTRNRINHCWRRLPREAFETTSYNTNLCIFHIKK